MSGQKHWYAVTTYSGHENKVCQSIQRQAEVRGLQDRIVDIRIPTELETRTRAGKRITVKRKLFPGYILIEMILDDDTWYLVKSTAGVTGFLSSGDKPVRLQPDDVAAILQTEEGSVQRPKVQWNAGDMIRVVSGPFEGFTGKIEDVNAEREKVRVFISIFGRETPVELEFTQVEKA